MGPFRRILPYIRRYRGPYLQGMVLVVLAVACFAAIPRLVGLAVDRFSQGAAPAGSVLLAAGAVVFLALARAILLYVGRVRVLIAVRGVEYDLRNDLFARLETLPARYYDAHSTGDITSRVVNDLEGVRMAIGPAVMYTGSTVLACAASVGMMFWISPRLAALCSVPLAAVVLVYLYTGSKVRKISLDVQDQLGALTSRAEENFSGVRVVRAFVREEGETDRFREASAEYRRRSLRLAWWHALSWALILILNELALVAAIYAGGLGIIGGTVTKGELTSFAIYLTALLWPLMSVGYVIHLVQRGLACMGRINEVFDTRPETDDSKAVPGGAPIRGEIEIRNLTFRYSPDRPPALEGLSLRIRAGERVALVGKTGAGKSTVVQLLLRLYAPPDGTIFVDGRDVNTLPLVELRRAIGTVPQDLFLFSDRIRANIAFGGIDGVSDAEAARAAEISRLSADLAQFPDGYEQVIGERGVTLSGGQKQRTALARAVVRDPRILILDDALSSVDAQTEREIRDRLSEFMKGRTCLVITHRLSAIADADRIFVLDGGRLAEEGRHGELLARGGIYAELWERQELSAELARS